MIYAKIHEIIQKYYTLGSKLCKTFVFRKSFGYNSTQ